MGRHPSKESILVEARRWLAQELQKQPLLSWLFSAQPEMRPLIEALCEAGDIAPLPIHQDVFEILRREPLTPEEAAQIRIAESINEAADAMPLVPRYTAQEKEHGHGT